MKELREILLVLVNKKQASKQASKKKQKTKQKQNKKKKIQPYNKKFLIKQYIKSL